jgi:hypothetical protein
MHFKYGSLGLQIIRSVKYFHYRQASVMPRFRLRQVSLYTKAFHYAHLFDAFML